MSATFGHLQGKLTLTIAGNAIPLGHVEIPVTGHVDRGIVRLSADTELVDVTPLYSKEGQDA